MKTSSSIKRNYFRRPAVRQLVPDLKLLLAVLQVGCESHVGCWVPSGLADDAGLSPEACEGGMQDLEKGGFLQFDKATGEIFLTDFFRNNSFKGPQRGQQALVDFRQVESEALRKSILKAVAQSPECGLSVEFLTSFFKNQRVRKQEKDQREVEIKKTTPPTPPAGVDVVGFDVDEVVRAELWELEQAGRTIGPGLEAHIRKRLANGLTDRDRASLEAFRQHKQRQQEMFALPDLPDPKPGEKFERQRAEVRAVLQGMGSL